MPEQPITVTQPNLPPLSEFIPYLEEIWTARQLTNNGPFVRQLEVALANRYGLAHVALVANGTLALLLAFRALGLAGEVITTPYTFVATAHSLLWSALEPVFVDVDPLTLNLDPGQVEAAITARTSAILPVHVYGLPCATATLCHIAARHGVKLIYDAAQAFGVADAGGSVLRHGDFSILSLHATKVFSTFEGGALVCSDPALRARIDRLRNFGIADEVSVPELGINAKMNEVQAAFGLLQLRHVDAAIARRREIDRRYRRFLAGLSGIRCLDDPSLQADWQGRCNHGSFPVFVEDGFPVSRDDLYARLRAAGVHCRRYFYPLLCDLPMYRHLPSAAPERLPVARRAAACVLCLPIYPALADADVDRIVAIIGDCVAS
jgi:dTDP-4-amino-4,6-dideoxygalactose transaminase